MAKTTTFRRRTLLAAALRRYWIAVVVAFLFMKSTAGCFWSEHNRFFFHWQRSDTLAVFGSIAVVATAFYSAYAVLSRLGRFGRYAVGLCFVCATVFYLKVYLSETLEAGGGIAGAFVPHLKWIIVCWTGFFFLNRRAVVRSVVAVCLIVSPIVPLYLLTLLRARPVSSVTRWEPARVAARSGGAVRVDKVLVLLFDEWSYTRTFENGRVAAEFPNIRRMAERAVVFHQGYSPASSTFDSVPSMLCGRVGRSVLRDGTLYLDDGENLAACNALDNMFKRMRRRGFRTAAYGACLPYAEIFGRAIDVSEACALEKVLGTSPLPVCAGMLLANLKIRTPSFLPCATRPFFWVKHRYYVQMHEWMRDRTLSELRQPGNSFVFVHNMIPHVPFIFTREGPRRNRGDRDRVSLPGYIDNLRFTDGYVGEVLDALEAMDPQCSVLTIMLSDHTFRLDPAFDRDKARPPRLCHIPLFVLLPGQTQRMDIEFPFSTALLADVVSQWLDSEMSVQNFAALCRSFNRSDIRVLIDGEPVGIDG